MSHLHMNTSNSAQYPKKGLFNQEQNWSLITKMSKDEHKWAMNISYLIFYCIQKQLEFLETLVIKP